MKVKTRSGKLEPLSLDKIKNRILDLCKKFNLDVDADQLTLKVVNAIYDGITTTELDEETARISVNDITNPDSLKFASIISIDNLHKNTLEKHFDKVSILFENGLVSKEYYESSKKFQKEINETIDYELDYNFDFFGFKTLEKAYLFKVNGQIVERPQDLFMREALGLYLNDIEKAIENYKYLCKGYFTHATPTLFNTGTNRTSLASCFLLSSEDSVEGLYKTVSDCAQISKYAGGIGVHLSMVRAKGSKVSGTNGESGGIVPYLRVLNDTARHINQCFVPETTVFTQKGPVPIKNIQIGDYVITENGISQKVVNIHKNNVSKNIYKLETPFFETRLTPEHEIAILSNPENEHITYIKQKIYNKQIKWDYKPVSSLSKTDYLVFPIPKEEIIPNYSDNFIKFLGFIKSPFCIYKKNEKNTFVLNLNKLKNFDKSDICEYNRKQIMHLLEKLYKDGIFEKINLKDNFTYEFSLKDINLNCAFQNLHSWDKNKIKLFLEGVVQSHNLNYNSFDKEYLLDLDDDSFVKTLFFLYLKLGYLIKIYYLKDGKVQVRVPNCKFEQKFKNTRDYFYYENNFYYQIKDKKTEFYEGDVYDLTVENDHSYFTTLGTVHNSGKRPGSFAIYLEPYHADIFDFLEMKKNNGKEEFRARDLFYALWIPDLFMKQVKEDGDWYLMCPSQSPNLNDVYGEEFEKLYQQYIDEGKYVKKVSARHLWKKILDAQIETGTPYLCYKDAANKKSNQKNIGTIKSSNLCVAPETKILTSEGYFPIYKLENQNILVWNGKEWSPTVVKKTGQNKELLKVYFNNNTFIECTREHRFYVDIDGKTNMVEADYLQRGMKLYGDYTFPIVEFSESNKEAKDTFDIPLNGSFKAKLNWLYNLIKNYGSLQSDKSMVISGMTTNFITDTRLLVQTLGTDCEIVYFCWYKYIKFTEEQLKYLSYIGSWDFDLYLEIQDENDIKIQKPVDVYISHVEITGRISDTYCFTEHKRHMGIFNGVLTGQCSEIMEYSDSENAAVCNLASIALPKFVKFDENNKPYFDFQLLRKITHMITENLNVVIDICFYPTPEARNSNLKYRPVGIGVQGLAYAYMMFRYPFESEEARKLNLQIFETIYYSALEKSCELAQKDGVYYDFWSSPLAKGKFQFDLWKEVHPEIDLSTKLSEMWDWEGLREKVMKYGVRNSLLTTCMPTASTSQILGNSECIEPITSNMYTRRVLSGEYIVLNPFLVKDLQKDKLWNKDFKDILQHFGGSLEEIPFISQEYKQLYKTAWDIPQKELIDQASDRGLFIDQSQSLNLFVKNPVHNKLTSMHFYAWKKGLKTGMYYLRTQSASNSMQFTVDLEKINTMLKGEQKNQTGRACPYKPGMAPEECMSCSS